MILAYVQMIIIVIYWIHFYRGRQFSARAMYVIADKVILTMETKMA